MMQYAALALLVGCSGKSTDENGLRGGLGGADLGAVENQVRFDVYPSESSNDLLKQTWIADLGEGLDGIEIVLETSITISGKVVGYQVNPLHSEVPGESRVPVDASIRVERPGTITGGSAQTRADGSFQLKVPASKGYTLSITPDDDLRLPFQVTVGRDLSEDLDLDTIDLGYGLPVYGHIRTDGGLGLHPLTVRLRDVESGVAGPSTVTDTTGHYLLRAEPGDYALEVEGQQGSALPSFTTEAKVHEGGLELDVSIGELLPSLIAGQVFGADNGATLRDIQVRLESGTLRGSIGALNIDTETDGDGLFGRQILAGTWRGSFIPPYDSEYGGVEEVFEVGPGQDLVNLGEIVLPERFEFEGFVKGPDGSPLANVAVNAQESNFERFIFSTVTDDDGGFLIEVPPGPMMLTVSPSEGSLAVTQWPIDPSFNGEVFSVKEGEKVSGVVNSPSGPVPFALIEVRTMDGRLLATTMSGESGQFDVSLSPL